MKYLIFSIFLLTGIFGCTSTHDSAPKDINYLTFIDSEQLIQIEKVTNFRYSGFNPLTDKYLTITAFGDEKYLIELTNKCFQLHDAYSIGIDSLSPSTLTTSSSIVVTAGVVLRCKIESIYPLSKEQHLKVLDINRAAKK